MTQTFTHSSTSLRTLAILSGLILGSCQTNAGDILATGSLEAASHTDKPTKGGYSDPRVVAVSATANAQGAQLALNEPATSLKRKPAPLAAAYSDIAEPPPEVLALQQQAMAGTAPAQDLGVSQPTEVNTHKNSLFSAGRSQPPAAPVAAAPPTAAAQQTGSSAQPVTSLVPGNMPTLGVNAMSKSLFSPSAEQQQMLSAPEQMAAPASDLPLVEPETGPPVLHKLSDPRPKRKILALREPTAGMPEDQMPAVAMPERVQLTPEQLAAMGAVPEMPGDGSGESAAVPDGEGVPTAKKKKWLPSLLDLLAGGAKTKSNKP
ncbi:hypothetical protein [Rhizobium sp. AG855]|uniref:hypothetical protein n=1 Tax=Rhizobium sp. AG855 TaxID=2183898 RepID=UPI000E75F954|nr:hypothetical protein [Rhizobium sp. AG855]RKE84902.1 hypothetical protein DFO46_1679 [Rhizobium sp. AG855]